MSEYDVLDIDLCESASIGLGYRIEEAIKEAISDGESEH